MSIVIRGKDGWPVERIKGKPFISFLRLLIHGNILQTIARANQDGRE